MSKTILCADDSVTMQKVAEITFRATDYNYVGARSADEALQKAKADKPTLVLVDAVMPGKSGYDLCQAIKSDPGLAGVPVVLMVGNAEPYDASRGAQVGIDAHVTKPWDTTQMLEKIEEIMQKGGGARPSAASATPPATPPQPPSTPAVPRVPTPAATAPSAPSKPQQPAAARAATMIGMPTIKMPPGLKRETPGVTNVTPQRTATPSVPSPQRPVPAPPAPQARTEAPRPAAAPARPAAAQPAPTAPAPRAPAPRAPAPAPRATAPAAPARQGLPTPPAGLDRPPMISGVPRRSPTASPVPKAAPSDRTSPATAAAVAHARAQVPPAAEQVGREAGLDPKGPEMAALVKLSREVVERVVWEVVPDLAEAIIRENLDRLTAKAR